MQADTPRPRARTRYAESGAGRMERVFGVPTTPIAIALAALWLLCALVVVALGLRNRVLVRLALRQIPRRRAQTGLVTLGLMLSSTIITTAFGTGDTMSHAIRTVEPPVSGALMK